MDPVPDPSDFEASKPMNRSMSLSNADKKKFMQESDQFFAQ